MLTVAISTLAGRAGRIVLPAPCDGIAYLILVQGGSSGPVRDDVTVISLAGRGLSNSRNAALDHAKGTFLVFCDDDMMLEVAGLFALRDHLVANPRLDFAAGWRGGRLRQGPCRALTRFNSGRICAPELMICPARFRKARVRFDPDFGLGSACGLGEEYVFVTDALNAGLQGQSVPVVTGWHAGASTGENWDDPALMQARWAVLRRVFGPWALAIRPFYALRHRHRLGSGKAALRFAMGQGLA